jgi:hypothetical protein
MTDEQKLNAQQRSLKEHLDAIISDVIVADKCYFLLKEIGQAADAINKYNFGELFGFLQDDLVSMYTLTLARLFEMPKRYDIRGIPATLTFLDGNRQSIPMVSRGMLIKELRLSAVEGLSDAELTHFAVEVMEAGLPNAEGTELFDALDAVLFRRDKSIAHNEIINDEEMPAVTWKKTLELLELAKTVITAIGGGYFGVSHKLSFDGTVRYLLSDDAQRTAIALSRLLRAGLRPVRRASMIRRNTRE